jgi:hypothetical protein
VNGSAAMLGWLARARERGQGELGSCAGWPELLVAAAWASFPLLFSFSITSLLFICLI